MDALIQSNIKDRLSGKSTRFSPEVMGMMKSKLFEETQGQVKRSQARVRSDAIRRGIYQSGVTSGAVKDVENEGLKAYSSGVRDILMQKAMTEYDDRIKSIDAAQNWLQATRQYALGREQNAIAREQIKATLEAASIQASASRYAADRGLDGALANAGASRAAAKMANQQWEASLVEYNGKMVPIAVANHYLNLGT
mgnify:FL=1